MRMQQLQRIALIAAALACDGGPTAPLASSRVENSTPMSPTAAGDLVEVDVHLEGCFHNQRLRVQLRLDGDSAIVEQFRGKGTLAPGYEFRPVTALSPNQLAGLFSLLDTYERSPKRMCTSSERGRVTITHVNGSVQTRTFNDSACRGFDGEHIAFNWFMLADVVDEQAGPPPTL